jgi:adenosylcobinamide-GDP ribazoletransferase
MRIVKSLFSAFLMYSRIPVPQVEWKEENRRFSLCFFPLIGAVIGGISMLWYFFCREFGVNGLLFSTVLSAIPVIVTGGIHLDGFCDVCDAKACCGSKEKMLAIMSDSHIGAFAAVNLALYFLLQVGLFSQICSISVMSICSIGFIQSRAWSGLGAVVFKAAKKGGTLQSFTDPAHKKLTVAVEIAVLAATSLAMIFIEPICGAFAVCGGAVSFVYYRIFSYRKFGGTTGDVAGYFLQICELLITAFAVVSSIITR